MPQIQAALKAANTAARGHVATLYEQAGASGGRMKIPPKAAMTAAIADLNNKDNVRDLNGKAVMPAAARRMAELDAWLDAPGNTRVRISEVDKYRQRIESDINRTKNVDEKDALGELLSTVDKWETDAFTRVVAGGNKAAYQDFLKARGAREDYNARFTKDKVINNLLSDNQLNPGEVRAYIFGDSSIIGNKHAASVVNRMNAILGPNSPEMQALRQDMLFDIVEPLMTTKVSADTLGQFITNYERTVRKNPDLVQALNPFGMTELGTAYRVAKALDDLGLADNVLASRFDPLKTLTRILLPNTQRLAHGQAKLNVLDRGVRIVANTVKPNKRRVYHELFGRDSEAPMLTDAGRTAIAAAMAQDDEEE
jgi:hypothetical protein